MLTASEFLQMSGRAGRRGMDTIGYVVTVSNRFQSAQETARLASSPPDPLNSQFTPTYGMVLNLLQQHTLEETEFLIRKSFGQFVVDSSLGYLKEEIGLKQQQLEELAGFECPTDVDEADFQEFLKNKAAIHDVHRQQKVLKQQRQKFGDQPVLQAEQQRLESVKKDLEAALAASSCSPCDEYNKHRKYAERGEKLARQLKKTDGSIRSGKRCLLAALSQSVPSATKMPGTWMPKMLPPRWAN